MTEENESKSSGGTVNVELNLAVFAVLVALTLTVVGLVLSGAASPVIVLSVAGVQVILVVTVLMHLRGEGRLLYSIIGFVVFFIAYLFAMLLLGYSDKTAGTEMIEREAMLDQQDAVAAESPDEH